MVEMSNLCRQDRSTIANKSNSRCVKVLMSPVLLSVLSLIATSDSALAHFPTPTKTQIGTGETLSSQKVGIKADNKNLRQRVSQSPYFISQQLSAPPLKGVKFHGNQISLNGRILPGAWLQRSGSGSTVTTHLSDGVVRQLIGVDLLDSNYPTKQPIQWFSSTTKPTILSSLLAGGYRYLDITRLAKTSGWQMKISGNTLLISTPQTKITNINQGKEAFGERVIVNLDRPIPWQITQELPVKKTQPQNLPDDPADTITPKPSSPPNREWTITLDGIADPSIIQHYAPPPPTPELPIPLLDRLKQLPIPPIPPIPLPAPKPEPLIQQVTVVNNQTIIRLSVPFGLAPLVRTLPNPNRLVIDIRPDAMVQRSITWAPGLRWRQQFVNLGKDRFPVVWLEMNPRTVGLKLKPIVTNSNSLVGTAPLIQTAQRYLAVAAINGGYFNRNNRLPLGAIRRDGEWLSSPILNRGAIAWNDSGQFYMGRLALQENVILPNNQKLPILTLNSGYVQNGIARYTPAWGVSYTPLTDNEIILVVQKNQITNQLPGGLANQTAIPIPEDGYLLILRGNAANSVSFLPIGSSVRIESSTSPTEFNRYPYILGAGPLLVQNRQIVLDGKGEGFGNAFITQKAIRSAICTNATGNLIIAAVHNRAGGSGPTLAEHAQLMQQMGCVNALNLDGGSSTSLYLGGQLLDRSPNTAARVHNGIGIFLQTP